MIFVMKGFDMNTFVWFLIGVGSTYLIMTNPEMAQSFGDMLSEFGQNISNGNLSK